MISQLVNQLMTLDVFSFMVLSLASWRLTVLLTIDDGPLGVFRRFRGLVHRLDPLSLDGPAELIDCPYCTGVWVSAAVVVAWGLWPVATSVIAFPLAMAGVVSCIQSRTFDMPDSSSSVQGSHTAMPDAPPADDMLAG